MKNQRKFKIIFLRINSNPSIASDFLYWKSHDPVVGYGNYNSTKMSEL